MRTVALKRLCTVITRGSAPTYSETSDGTAWAIGQSCQTTEGEFDLSLSSAVSGRMDRRDRL